MNELARFIMQNLILDFQHMDVEDVRAHLREDDSPAARALLSKVIEDNGIDELLIVLADTLQDHIRSGISEDLVTDQLTTYVDA